MPGVSDKLPEGKIAVGIPALAGSNHKEEYWNVAISTVPAWMLFWGVTYAIQSVVLTLK